MATTQNFAAWIETEKGYPFVVREAPYPDPKSHELVIKSAAVAINTVDWLLQRLAIFPVEYPHIFGEDVAGEVVQLGADVKGFKVGDRVAA
jgi:NADPH:quinone reductase-like Zn-dependent oxidoreductase